MKVMKDSFGLAAGVFALLVAVYFLPYFVSLNDHKDYISRKIEEIVKFKVDVKGDVTFAILPVPSIVLKNVDFRGSPAADGTPSDAFLNTDRLFISVNLIELAKGEIKIENIIVNNGRFDYSAYRKGSSDADVGEFLSGRRFKNLALKNSVLVFRDGDSEKIWRLFGVDMNLRAFNDTGISGSGSFKYGIGRIDGVSFLLNFTDAKNYSLNVDFSYAYQRSSVDTKLGVVVKDGAAGINGRFDLSSDAMGEFAASLDKDFYVPDIPFFKERLRIGANVQTANDTLMFSNGTLDGGDTFASWQAEVPFEKGDSGGYSIVGNAVDVKVDFKNAPLAKFLSLGRDFQTDIIGTLSSNRELLRLFMGANVRIMGNNLALEKGVVTNVSVEALPIPNGVVISKLAYSLGRESFSASGVIADVDSDMRLDLDVRGTPAFSIPNRLFKSTRVANRQGKIAISGNSFKASGLDVDLGGAHVVCDIDAAFDGGRGKYGITLKSDKINTAMLTGEKVDLPMILGKLAQMKSTEFALNAMVKRLEIGETAYDLFKLDAAYDGSDLKISRLTFKNGGLSSDIRGSLVDLAGQTGSFKGFTYVITSDSLKGLSIPLIKNKFVERIVANGANRIDIRLDGDAANPNADVHANLPDVSMDIKGRLLDGDSDYGISFSHNELGGFLFSWGYVGDALLDYFYDGVPFSINARIDGYDLKDVDLRIKDNVLSGEILRSPVSKSRGGARMRIAVDLSSARLDLRSVFKRLATSEAYTDFLLKIIRTLEYDIRIKAGEVVDYDGNVYGDVSLEILNASNPGRFRLGFKKGGRTVSMDSEILNNRIFSGVFRIDGYARPDDVRLTERMNLKSGLLSAVVNFKTDGMNFYQVISNLGGDFTATLKDGTISGIGGYDKLLSDILGLSNISTNSILYVLEEGFKTGTLEFSALSASGRIDKSAVERAPFTLSSNNMSASGFVTTNLIKKSLDIESVFEISGLAPETLALIYDLNGFVNNLEGRINTGALVSKISTPYLQKKKREMCKAGDSTPPRANRPEFCD
ncbi:MAG: hypothetical protein LBI17_00470 [Rickettsiales bacterium]|jgi:uncharacterized protein involved in outer membrane biogenesis|nr:hypothetical protein [Rickettsiales bacterium]